MKANDLMDAMNYLDDELLLESELIDNSKSSFKVTPIKKKSSVLFLSVSLAASILLIGYVIISISGVLDRAKKASDTVTNHEEQLFYDEIQGAVQETAAGADSDIESADEEIWFNGEVEETEEAEEAEDRPLNVAPELESITVLGSSYVLSDLDFEEEKLGEYIGIVEDSSNAQYVNCHAYSYGDNQIAIEYEDSFIVFEEQ